MSLRGLEMYNILGSGCSADVRRKYANGAVGTFMHGIALQGTNDSIELQVFADGVSRRILALPTSALHPLSYSCRLDKADSSTNSCQSTSPSPPVHC